MSDEPIKFRCYRCGKLLGAPRRRAGRVTTCPQCRAEIQVPGAEPESDDPPLVIEPAPPSDEELRIEPEPVAILAIPDVEPAPAAEPGLVIPPIRYDPPPAPTPGRPDVPRPADVILPPSVVLAWSLLVLAAVPFAFLAGLLLGHFVWK